MKSLTLELLVLGLAGISVAFANYKPRTGRAFVARRSDLGGTYRIAFCAGPCPDTTRADVVGYLVLSVTTCISNVVLGTGTRSEGSVASGQEMVRPRRLPPIASWHGASVQPTR